MKKLSAFLLVAFVAFSSFVVLNPKPVNPPTMAKDVMIPVGKSSLMKI